MQWELAMPNLTGTSRAGRHFLEPWLVPEEDSAHLKATSAWDPGSTSGILECKGCCRDDPLRVQFACCLIIVQEADAV